ncbi:hypothetical protein [Streptomyces incanus]|uniref:Uncharacterized protein n=1 Tax=Streptomyces incanus TaxID=887453 RepID=A0ABW0XN20_9ACTN
MVRAPGPSRTAFVAVVLTGGPVAATTTAAAVLWAHGQDTVPLWLTAAPPLTLVALSLAVALTAIRRTRHREYDAPVRPARKG